jgi:hypothetical protein
VCLRKYFPHNPPVALGGAGLSRQNWAYIAYALTALTAIIWLLTLVMMSRIAVAVACIKVGGCCTVLGAAGRQASEAATARVMANNPE